uniref:Uncharacterized protein n=1 Tax=Anguilla anguilla TaxID=7936 RepID=A0A0E9UVM0_ANGAN
MPAVHKLVPQVSSWWVGQENTHELHKPKRKKLNVKKPTS